MGASPERLRIELRVAQKFTVLTLLNADKYNFCKPNNTQRKFQISGIKMEGVRQIFVIFHFLKKFKQLHLQ